MITNHPSFFMQDVHLFKIRQCFALCLFGRPGWITIFVSSSIQEAKIPSEDQTDRSHWTLKKIFEWQSWDFTLKPWRLESRNSTFRHHAILCMSTTYISQKTHVLHISGGHFELLNYCKFSYFRSSHFDKRLIWRLGNHAYWPTFLAKMKISILSHFLRRTLIDLSKLTVRWSWQLHNILVRNAFKR